MAEQIEPVDIDGDPDLLRLAEEVQASHRSRILRSGGKEVAMIVPLPPKRAPRRKKPTPEDIGAFRSAFGGWADIDTDKLIEEIYETRHRSTRPTLELRATS